MRIGARASAALGEVVSAQNFAPASPVGQKYQILAAGLHTGIDWKHFGVELGGNAIRGVNTAKFGLFGIVRGDHLERGWGELQVGSTDPILDPRVLAFGGEFLFVDVLTLSGLHGNQFGIPLPLARRGPTPAASP